MNQPAPAELPYNAADGQSDDDRLKAALAAIVSRLAKEAEERVQKRRTVEQRWIRDLRQLHGEYDPDILKELDEAKKSKLFVNMTGPKTDACEGRLSDMLFPTDDRNWGILPTPVPELEEQARRSVEQAQALVAQANEAEQVGQREQAAGIIQQADAFAETARRLKAEKDEASRRAEAMAAEIDDQLTECQYAIAMRDVIRDACEVGTGIAKGPIASTDRARRSWRKVPQPDGAVIYQLEMVEDPRPAYVRVDPWNFFPDPEARTVQESESFFERHLKNRKGLRALARQPGFDANAIRRLLHQDPERTLPVYLSDLRAITGENQAPTDARYQVWEYRGPITAEEMRDLCHCLGKQDLLEGAGLLDEMGEVDPLREISVVLWFCENEVLKFGIHHLDSGEPIYSIYNVKKDASSIWGFGIPYLMRAGQAAINGAWRMAMDNAGLSCGPQIVIDQEIVEPVDGDWALTARKMWLRKKTAPEKGIGFEVHNIDSHLEELQAIILLAKQFIDDETSISMIAQGEQGAHVTQTAQGMAILMNAVNVMFRRLVKQFDDDITVPNLRRLYDWNMQFSQKEHIKGDFEVDARGTSVLLVRELQAQNLMALLNFTGHPVLGPMLKPLDLFRKTVQSMMISADDVVVTDEEYKRYIDQLAQQPEEQDPNLLRAQAQLEAARIEAETRKQIALIQREIELTKLAAAQNMTVDELRTRFDMEKMKIDSSERKMAAEIAVEARHAGGPGSGGFVSPPPARRSRNRNGRQQQPAQ